MFGFSRVTKYDEEYLNEKKNIFEELLAVKEKFDALCVEYDENYRFLKKSFETVQNTDFVSLMLNKSRKEKSSKSVEEVINEAMNLQRSEYEKLKAKLDSEFVKIFNEQIYNSNAKYHKLFVNVYDTEQVKFNSALAWYKELDLLKFVKRGVEFNYYLQALQIIYSNFLAKEYSKLKQVR